MKAVPYAWTQAPQYAMLCTAPDVCLVTCLARGYKGGQGVDHQTAVKIVLGVNKDMFLDYGCNKEFGVQGYVDASFNTYPSDSEKQTGYVQWSDHLEQLQVERGSNIYNMTQRIAKYIRI